MKHLFAVALLAITAVLGITQDSQANGGLFRRNRGCDGCSEPCAQPCAQVAPAPVEAKWEERKVTRYKPVMKEREIEVLECKRVTREEKYTFTVSVPVEKMEKRMITICTPVSKEVDYTYTVMVPKCIDVKVTVCNYRIDRQTVTEKVPVCRTVCVNYVDECGRCCVRREQVTEMVERTRCVVTRVPVMEERIVKKTICEAVQHQGKKTICEIVRSQKEEMVKVCSFERQNREGVRTVCDVVTEKVKRKVQFCEMVAYEETVRVQVGGCAPAYQSDCNSGGGNHGGRGGFFRRGGGCH
jgi:hypothetical protein